MYQQVNGRTVLRLSDHAAIPIDARNADYQAYLRWVALGNAPESAAPEPESSPTRDERLQEAITRGKEALASASTLAEVKAVFSATLDGLGAAITGGGA